MSFNQTIAPTFTDPRRNGFTPRWHIASLPAILTGGMVCSQVLGEPLSHTVCGSVLGGVQNMRRTHPRKNERSEQGVHGNRRKRSELFSASTSAVPSL
jgi:hypothetical protein